MQRRLSGTLKNWLVQVDRKPLVLRGARQVGKTWLVRDLADAANKQLIEFNFEKQPELASLFDSNNPQVILGHIAMARELTIAPEQCLLFLDEIQACPELLSKLRWFAEDMPELAVVAAGSLLEFTLADHDFSMPVGRINYMHVEPLSFEEFLLALDKTALYDYLQNYHVSSAMPLLIHQQLTDLLFHYLLIGGMPAAISAWLKNNTFNDVALVQHDLLASYRDDFAKYAGKLPQMRFNELITKIPAMLGQKFVYSQVNKEINLRTIKQALQLLSMSRVCHQVFCSSANGLPIAAGIKEKFFKVIFLDIGLVSNSLGLRLHQIQLEEGINLANQGGLAEQLVGQLLRVIEPAYVQPALYYWAREEKNNNAEVDYLIQHANSIIPVEVKAGSTGSLKSLHVLMALKQLKRAVRVNNDLPSIVPVAVKTQIDKPANYELLSIPFYLIEQLPRLLDA